MYSRSRLRCWSIVLIVAALACSPELFARDLTKRVVFPKGKNTVVYRGKLTRVYADYDAYLLRARKGQTITVKLTTRDRDASFAIYETKVLGPAEDTILPNNENLRLFSGKLPVTSEYSIQIYGVTSIDDQEPSGAAYTLEITLR